MTKIVLLVLCAIAIRSHAVIVAGGDGTRNTNAPTGGQGWDYVGRITGSAPSSVTYLGNNWFITANHVKLFDNPTGVLLGVDTYTVNSGSWTRITNSVGTNADLNMFRVDETVTAPDIGISSIAPASNTVVTMIGNGLDRYPDLISASGELLYLVKSGDANTSKRWGYNRIEGDGGSRESTVQGDFSSTKTLFTKFDPFENEAQGAKWDSGGGVFVENDGAWELAGIMIEVDNTYSIGGTNAVMFTGGGPTFAGSETYLADLSIYADQINATVAIPEPSVLAMFSVVPAAVFIRRIFLI